MERRSFSDTGRISITVDLLTANGADEVTLANIPLSMTIGDLKKKLNVQPNSRLGRPKESEHWDNQRHLSDFFVRDFEQLVCVVKSADENGQNSFDNYDQWLAKRANS